jgi:hypothetical protein
MVNATTKGFFQSIPMRLRVRNPVKKKGAEAPLN